MEPLPAKAQRIVEALRALRVQGATQVALEGLKATECVLRENTGRATTKGLLLRDVQKMRDLLLKARPTEPFLWNCLQGVLAEGRTESTVEGARESMLSGVGRSREHINTSHEACARRACSILRKHRTFFTHCHSSTVTSALQKLHSHGYRERHRERKGISVFCTETRPLFQGRRTARELAAGLIPVTIVVDSAASQALEEASVCLLGADAVNAQGDVYNKVGSSTIAHLAGERKIPVYILTDSWKYLSPAFSDRFVVEVRSPREIWKDAPQGVKICNPAFDRIHSGDITGIITELGVCRPKAFEKKVLRAYPFLRGAQGP